MLDVVLQITHERANIKQLKLGSLTTIGRGAECNLKIASGEISRRHCQLTVDDDKVQVRDLGSSNGTYLNGKLIPPNQDIELSPGSRLTIGPVKCVVQFTSPKSAMPPTPAATQAGETIVFTPDSTARTKGSDLDFTFMQSEAGEQVAAEIGVASSKKPDTELDMNLAADAAQAARNVSANAGDSSSPATLNTEPAASPATDEPTQFLFGPDDTVPPGTLHAPVAEQPGFGEWNESESPSLGIPIEPISIPATKRRKGIFDLFKRRSKEPAAPAEPPPPPAPHAEPIAAAAAKLPEPAGAPPSPAATPASESSVPAAEPQAAAAPATPATTDDIEPFWN